MHIAAVVGLGNPGREYAATRHNVGFRVIDELARRWRLRVWWPRHHARIARRRGGSPVWLVKPTTYMNLSGDAVASLLAAERLAPAQVLVVVDDVDLPLGALRVRPSGGAGTHNGLRSVVGRIGEGFPRLRLGVRGQTPWEDLAAYVLAPFAAEEEAQVEAMIVRAADCVETALHAGIARAASRFNTHERRVDEP